MKTRLWQTTAIMAVLLTAAAVGQSIHRDQIVRVPFPFVVADRSLPAGQYFVTNIGETRLRTYNSTRQSVLVQVHSVQGHAPESSGRMVFHRFGGVYFLSDVWTPGQNNGQLLTRSRAEKERRKLKTIEPGTQNAVLSFNSIGH